MNEEPEGYAGFEGFEHFSGMLSDGIWLRLIIEDVIIEMKYETLEEITALNVAKEVLTLGNLPGTISTGDLLEACDGYLDRYNDIFSGLGYVGYDFNDRNELGEYYLGMVLRTKSKLFKAHTTELDAYLKQDSEITR